MILFVFLKVKAEFLRLRMVFFMIGCGQSKGGSRKGGNAMKKQKVISGTGGPMKKISLGEEIRKKWFFYLIPIPGIICLLLFSYMPMAGLYVVLSGIPIRAASSEASS